MLTCDCVPVCAGTESITESLGATCRALFMERDLPDATACRWRPALLSPTSFPLPPLRLLCSCWLIQLSLRVLRMALVTSTGALKAPKL